MVSTLVEEGERRATEADRLQQELIRARIAEKQAKEKLSSFVHSFNHSASTSSSTLLNTPLFTASLLNATSTPHLPVTAFSHRYRCGRLSDGINGKAPEYSILTQNFHHPMVNSLIFLLWLVKIGTVLH